MRLLLSVSGLLWSGLAFAQSATPPMTREQQEHFLATAKVIRLRAAKGGITGSRCATLSDGATTHDAHVQIIDESKARFEGAGGTELNFRDSYKFNIAAYRLDKLLGLQMGPPCVERSFQGTTGSFCWWVDNVMMEEGQRMKKKIAPPPGADWNNQMYIVRVFDQLIYNTDRNVGNLLITKDWKLWMIDHTRAFRTHTQIKTPKNLVRCDRGLLDAMKRLDEQGLKAEMDNFLTLPEIRGMLKRRDQIVAFFEKAEPQALFESKRRP